MIAHQGQMSPEFELLTGLCAWPRSPGRDAAAQALAGGQMDWDLFFALVRRHRVEGLVAASLKSATIAPPERIAKTLAARATQICVDNLVIASESVQLHILLAGRGLEPVFLKGTTLAILAYKTLALKHSRDIDLIVAPDLALEALGVLRARGYEFVRPELRDPGRLAVALEVLKECELIHGRTGLIVELHWRLFDVRHFLPSLDRPVQTRLVKVGTADLATYDENDLFAYLCAHGARHGWARLKWLADLNALIESQDPQSLERLHAAAIERGGGRSPAVALLLCHNLFGLALREGFVDELRAERLTRWLLFLTIQILGRETGAELTDRPLARIQLEVSQLLLGLGWRHACSVIGNQWAGANERLAFPLPRRLRFLYIFLGPLLRIVQRVRSVQRRPGAAHPAPRPPG